MGLFFRLYGSYGRRLLSPVVTLFPDYLFNGSWRSCLKWPTRRPWRFHPGAPVPTRVSAVPFWRAEPDVWVPHSVRQRVPAHMWSRVEVGARGTDKRVAVSQDSWNIRDPRPLGHPSLCVDGSLFAPVAFLSYRTGESMGSFFSEDPR